MKEYSKTWNVESAALRAGMHRETAAKYIKTGKLPSEMKQPRNWKTRPDPFEADWPELEAMLTAAPELESKALFTWLAEEHRPGVYQEGQVRTFQRKVKQWRATLGPPKEVFFAQEHRPGEALQTDFTSGDALSVTVAGESFAHLLCHTVLPYSNWEWATVCQSESMISLRRGVQVALFTLGRSPNWHQTDNSTAATHEAGDGDRKFNQEYLEVMNHFGMKPRTIGVGRSSQNGDVEALNRALKARLKQHLLLRGSRDFPSVDAYEEWVQAICKKANTLRQERLAEELLQMKPLTVQQLPEWTEKRVRVQQGSTIRIKHNSYSVPSQLIGEEVRVRVWDNRLEVYYADRLQLTIPRLLGRGGSRINYRHVIDSLVRKPGSFERYRYREDLFPTITFRKAFDAIERAVASTWKASLEYLRILHLAAKTMECDVELALSMMLDDNVTPTFELVRQLVVSEEPTIPKLRAFEANPAEFDRLLRSLAELQEAA